MFEKLIDQLELAGLSKAKLRCPECGATPTDLRSNSGKVITCANCGVKASRMEWAFQISNNTAVTSAHSLPTSSKIREESVNGGTTWHIPASGKFGAFLFFGLFWCSLTSVATYTLLFGQVNHPNNTHPAFLGLFLAVFWAIGLGMLYASFRHKYCRHRLHANSDWLYFRRDFWGRPHEKQFRRASIQSVSKVVFYTQNYKPVHGIEIKAREGKLRFGSTLQEEEKSWLCARIHAILFPQTECEESDEIQDVSPASSFSIAIPQSSINLRPVAFFMLILGIVGFVVDATLLYRNFSKFFRDFNSSLSMFDIIFHLIGSGFSIILFFISLIFAGIGYYLLRDSNSSTEESYLEGDATHLIWRVKPKNQIWQQKQFPRETISDVRTSKNGSINHQTMNRIELIIGDEVELLTRWVEAEKAVAFVREVRRQLGRV